jgi:hypothetical protein
MKLFGARFFLWTIIILFWIVLPADGEAATLYLDPDGGEYHPGDTFVVDVRLDPNGDCVNVVSADITYPKEYLRASAFSQGESILTLWTEAPKIVSEEGRITFMGGVPGGFCGRIPGDPGYANIVGKIIFSVPATAPYGVTPPVDFLSSTQVLLADGRGTPAPLMTRRAVFTLASSTGASINEWLDEIREDDVPPEPFSIDLHRDPNTAAGKYFIVFQTTDKQSGVAKYELIERDRDRPQYVRGERSPAVWRPVESPYVLTDQSLNSTIVVRAIDHAGQVREESLLPTPNKVTAKPSYGVLLWLLTAFVGAIGVTIFLRRKHPHVP